MRNVVRWIGVLALAWAVAGCGKKEVQTMKPSAKLGPEVVVWVDQTGITGTQVQQEASRLIAKLPKNLSPEQLAAVQGDLLRQAVDNLVVRQLVRAEMERSGTIISREEIEKGKKDIEKALGPGASLALLLADANVSMEEMEKNLALDLFKNKMIQDRVAAAQAAVTEETAQAYYDAHPEEFTEPAGRLAWHILVQVPKDASEQVKADARAKAEGIRRQLLDGADFAKLARETSDCTSRSRGGELGVIPRGREAREFEDAVYGQEIGAIGEVVESPVGFHVIKVTGEQEEKLAPFDNVKANLITLLKGQAQQKVAAEYVVELRAKATVKLDGVLAAAATPAAGNESEDPPAEAPAP